MMGAFLDKNTCVGLILGTGSNACYLERADRVKHWETKRHGEKEVNIYFFLIHFLLLHKLNYLLNKIL